MLAFLFPGQGSQFPGMARFLWDQFALAKSTFEEASSALGIDMQQLLFDSSEADLAMTANTQPAILLASIATERVLGNEFGIKPKVVAGHSVGEYAALVSAGTLPFDFALKAVRRRGEAMQAAVPVGLGGMIAVLGLENDQAYLLCKAVEDLSGFKPLTPANFNCSGQIVLSGSMKAIEWLQKEFKIENLLSSIRDPAVRESFPKRLKLIPLNVSAPFHCSMMAPAEVTMTDFLAPQQFKNANLPIVQNVNALPEIDGNKIKANLIKQISGPVLWTQSIQKIQSLGVNQAIECGAGKVLSGLLKKITGDSIKVFGTNSSDELLNLKSISG